MYDETYYTTFQNDSSGNFTLDAVGDIELNGDGGQVTIKDGSSSHFLFDCDNTKFTIYDDTDEADLFSITVAASGATTLATVDDGAAIGHLTLDIDGDNIKELFFGDHGGAIHGIDSYGDALNGFPVQLPGDAVQIWGSPAADDLDQDGVIELVFTSKNKHIYVLDVYGNIELEHETDQYMICLLYTSPSPRD